MAASPISQLTKNEQRELLDDLNYLNLAEIKQFCRRHSIPFKIAVETKDGARKTTSEDDRKGVILDRIRQFLRTGKVPRETRFPASVVCFDPLPNSLTADARLFYGQYDKTDRAMIATLAGTNAEAVPQWSHRQDSGKEVLEHGDRSHIRGIRLRVAGGTASAYRTQCGMGFPVGPGEPRGSSGLEEVTSGEGVQSDEAARQAT
jgi:hypothetical protein